MNATRVFWLLVGIGMVGFGFSMAYGPLVLLLTVISMIAVIVLAIRAGRGRR